MLYRYKWTFDTEKSLYTDERFARECINAEQHIRDSGFYEIPLWLYPLQYPAEYTYPVVPYTQCTTPTKLNKQSKNNKRQKREYIQ
jgi:hypothetical protein